MIFDNLEVLHLHKQSKQHAYLSAANFKSYNHQSLV